MAVVLEPSLGFHGSTKASSEVFKKGQNVSALKIHKNDWRNKTKLFVYVEECYKRQSEGWSFEFIFKTTNDVGKLQKDFLLLK